MDVATQAKIYRRPASIAPRTKVSKMMLLVMKETTKELRRTKEHVKVKDPKTTIALMSSNMRNLRITPKRSAIIINKFLILRCNIKPT